jgi:hypothetical protein
VKPTLRRAHERDHLGKLFYGDARFHVSLEDRALAHLQLVIINKLRRNESFTFSWVHGSSEGHGRSTIWISSSVPLHFEFDGGRPPALNRLWLEELAQGASTTSGLFLTEEPVPAPESPQS